MKIETDICVVGGGASGIVCAICAAEAGAGVLVVEGNKELGKKILSTGNGKCNFTNENISSDCYHSSDSSFVLEVLDEHGCDWSKDFFSRFGIWPLTRRGCVYPNSESAADFRAALDVSLRRLGADILTDCRIHKIIQSDEGYILYGNRAFKSEAVTVSAKRCVLASGGLALPQSGSDGEGLDIAASMGLRIIHPLPSLTALKTGGDQLNGLSSVRVNGKVSVYADGKLLAEDFGQLQLRDDGISGIPAFQVSAPAARAAYEGKEVSAVMDFFPDFSIMEIESALEMRLIAEGWGKSAREALYGFLPGPLLEKIFVSADVNSFDDATAIVSFEINRLATSMKNFSVPVIGTRSFDSAQTTSGGVYTGEIDPGTMESKKYPGLYFAGEIMDVDGICGGYNLHWAFVTGVIAGESAAKAVMGE